ncbi:MAG: NAD-dependent epimerase/dehydratase family protein [Candidatus Latescibacteria bacterium]|nr:NAD-dependent epimerase/dehydratase family protein [Candidatus Latescibacterota bacterium]
MKILITGITGRIGANVAVSLQELGHQVRGLVWGRDQRQEKLAGLGVELQQGSLTERADVERAVAGVDAIYHLGAAFQGGGPFTDEEYFEINVRGTFNMLEAARYQESVGQFIFASSDALFQKYIPGGMDHPIGEEEPVKPGGWYALSKALGEQMCQTYWRSYGLATTSLRFAMVLGAGEILHFPQFYLSKMKDSRPELAALWKGEERLLVLQDENGRSYKKHVADVRDIVAGCVCALGKKRAAGEIIQLAGPAAFTWDQAVYRLAEIRRIEPLEVQVGGNPTYYEFDLSKARELLGFEPQYDIVRMIVDALSYERGEAIGVLPTG